MKQQVLALMMENRFGALNKVTTLFSRKGCHIRSLTAVPEEREEISRVTVEIREPEEKVRQMILQLNKLEDIRQVVLQDAIL